MQHNHLQLLYGTLVLAATILTCTSESSCFVDINFYSKNTTINNESALQVHGSNLLSTDYNIANLYSQIIAIPSLFSNFMSCIPLTGRQDIVMNVTGGKTENAYCEKHNIEVQHPEEEQYPEEDCTDPLQCGYEHPYLEYYQLANLMPFYTHLPLGKISGQTSCSGHSFLSSIESSRSRSMLKLWEVCKVIYIIAIFPVAILTLVAQWLPCCGIAGVQAVFKVWEGTFRIINLIVLLSSFYTGSWLVFIVSLLALLYSFSCNRSIILQWNSSEIEQESSSFIIEGYCCLKGSMPRLPSQSILQFLYPFHSHSPHKGTKLNDLRGICEPVSNTSKTTRPLETCKEIEIHRRVAGDRQNYYFISVLTEKIFY